MRRESLLVYRQSTPIYVVEYHRCYPDHVVLARAISRLGERGYSVYANNCEHFANWCKIGADQSSQVCFITGVLVYTLMRYGWLFREQIDWITLNRLSLFIAYAPRQKYHNELLTIIVGDVIGS